MQIYFRVIILGIFLQLSVSFSQLPTISAQFKSEQNRAFDFTAFRFQHIGEKDGLSQHKILSIIQDRHGFLWLATGDGLVRYDGYSFQTFTNIFDDSTSLSNNNVNYLFEDSRGWLWVGTDDGLNYFNPRTESFIRIRTLP